MLDQVLEDVEWVLLCVDLLRHEDIVVCLLARLVAASSRVSGSRVHEGEIVIVLLCVEACGLCWYSQCR